jgi:PKD repeat protein
MFLRLYSFVLLIFLVAHNTFGQTPVAQFYLASSACIKEGIQTTNNSANSNRYEWDLCQGDLSLSPVGSVFDPITNVTIPLGLDLVFDGTNWYGFITSRSSNSIIRYKFDSDFSGITEVTDLGNIGNLLSQPVEIKVVTENGKWFGFVSNQSSTVTTSLITRIDFGINLTNTSPTAVSLILDINFATDAGLDIIFDGSLWYLIYNQIGLGPVYKSEVLRLATLESLPSSLDRLSIIYSDMPNLHDIKFLKQNGTFHAYSVADSPSKLYHLDFGSNLFSTPSIVDISSVLPNGLYPYGVDGDYDNGQHYLFIVNDNGEIVRINLGENLNNLPLDGLSLGNLGTFTNTRKIRLIKDKTQWLAFSINYSDGIIYKATFPQPSCPSTKVLTTTNVHVSFEESGTKAISLRAFNGAVFDERHERIVISTLTAPEIHISNLGVCKENLIQFSLLTNQIINTILWELGDTSTSTLPAPTHQYSLAGLYTVRLNVTAENGCNNYVEKPIKIYDPPTASFTLPPGLICTNNEFNFVNNTVDNFEGNLTYEWLVNDVLKSTSRDFNYAFTAGGDQQVKLKTSIPGCSDELSQTLLNVQPGPVVDFSFTGKCEEEEIVFTNASSGSIMGYQWDFDNGNTSTEVNPTETFNDYGNYQVSLITTGTNGCASTITKPVTIYSVPQTNFSIDLPPFSCSGSASQFNDLTPSMPDSNITSWAWSFGDPSNGASSQKNPLYTYSQAGDYSVALSTSTNFGCSNTVQKTVTIFPSPIADFSFGPACVNQETQFTDLSAGDIKSWLWSIQGNTYSSPNPKHIFKSSSAYNALLTVTGNNGCISQTAKSVNVPVPVSPDFSSSSTCASKPSVFDEVTKGGVDPAVSWTWSFASQGSGTGSPTEHVFPSTGNYSVTMNSTRQSGCTYSITKTIPITDAPKAQFSLFLESGAAPFTVNVTNASTKATKYVWKPGDPKQANSTAFVPSFTYVDLGDYTIELEAGNELGCKDYMQQQVHVVIPQINAAVSDFRLEVIPGSDYYSPVVTIENKSNVALINPTVNLDLSGNATVSQTVEAIIRPNELLPYRFTSNISPVSLAFACAEVNVSADEYAFDNRQCVNLEDEYVSMIPYPNPASDELMLEWINNQDEPMEVVICNAAGQTIISRKYSPALKGLNQVSLDVSALSAGIYFVSFSIDGRTRNFRFSIVR